MVPVPFDYGVRGNLVHQCVVRGFLMWELGAYYPTPYCWWSSLNQRVSYRTTRFLEDDHIYSSLQVTACFSSLVSVSNYRPPSWQVPPEKLGSFRLIRKQWIAVGLSNRWFASPLTFNSGIHLIWNFWSQSRRGGVRKLTDSNGRKAFSEFRRVVGEEDDEMTMTQEILSSIWEQQVWSYAYQWWSLLFCQMACRSTN